MGDRQTRTWEVVTLARWWLVSDDVLHDETLLEPVVRACIGLVEREWRAGGGLFEGLRVSTSITDQDPASPDYKPGMRCLLIELRGIGYQRPVLPNAERVDEPRVSWWRRLWRAL